MKDNSPRSNTLLKHTFLFSIFVLLAQVIGLVRDLYLARVFGVTQILDVYYMAFKIPDFLNVFYSVFLGSVVFIPLLTAAKNTPWQGQGINPLALPGGVPQDGGEAAMRQKINTIGSFVLVLILCISLILFVFMPQLASLIAPTWSTEQVSLLTNLSRILLLAQLFFPIGILAGSLCMVYEKPFYMAISGATYNFFILLGSLLLVPLIGIYGVVISVGFAALAFMLVQIYPKDVRNILFYYKFEWNTTEWFMFFKQNISRFFAVLVYQLFGILLLFIASFSGIGGVSVFSIAYNVFMALFFVLGASLSTAAMPNISKLHVEGNTTKQKDSLNNSLVYLFFVSVFIALFGVVFSTDLIKLLYYFSQIAPDKELLIASTFGLLILSLPFFNILEIVRKYFYSTNQIFLAGGITITLLVSVMGASIFMNKVVHMQVLSSLCFSILFGNVFCSVIILYILNKKSQIELSAILRLMYKPFITALVSFFVFRFTEAYVYSYTNCILTGNLGIDYFATLFIKGIFLFLLFVVFTFVFRDEIGKNILRQIKSFVV